jgi:lipid-A-disaccharide synthase
MPSMLQPETGPGRREHSVRLLISAGEASGDMHGAALVGALRQLALPAPVECFGLGGERLRAAGCETVVDAKDVAVLGLAEVAAHLPRIYRRFRRLLAEADRRRPDAAVLIDFPEFNFRLARQLHRRGIPVIYYISPQLWAWRKGRVKLVQRDVRKMLVIFPFEREFYRRHGVEVEFVGHPLAERAVSVASERDSRQIALLPGSRRKEIELNLPAMLEAAAHLHARHAELRFAVPLASTIDRGWLERLVARLRGRGTKFPLELVADAQKVLAGSQAAVVASGTATLEAALAGTPFIMVYRLTGLTWLLGRRLVDVPFFCIVNLIAGRKVVSELVQQDFTAANVSAEVERVLADGPERRQMLEGLREVRAKLSVQAGASASMAAALEVLKIVQLETRRKETQAAQSG